MIYYISVSQIENLHFGGPDQNIFYCRFGCGWVLENTRSKRHGLIHFRSINIVHLGIVLLICLRFRTKQVIKVMRAKDREARR
jgi:hypothetical protein